MRLADMHLHSCHSDGTQAPAQLARQAWQLGMGLVCLTDHDTLGGTSEMLSACKILGLRTLTGVELTALFEGQVYHVLGYGVDAKNPTLKMLAQQNKNRLLHMSLTLICRMQKDYPQLSLDEYRSFVYDAAQGGWKGLHYYRYKGVVQTLPDAMKLYEKYEVRYSDEPFETVEKVCQIVRQAGGTPVLAHPGVSLPHHGNMDDFRQTLHTLIDQGIGGLEAYYPQHTAEITQLCIATARQKGLWVTGGSDSHGDFLQGERGKQNRMGALPILLSDLVLS